MNDVFNFTFSEEEERAHRHAWMNDNQWQCWMFLAELYCGWHHLENRPKEFGDGIELNVSRGDFSTFDSSLLTRAVLMAHRSAIRLSIEPSAPRLLKLVLFRRGCRDGKFYERHPDIHTAVAEFEASC